MGAVLLAPSFVMAGADSTAQITKKIPAQGRDIKRFTNEPRRRLLRWRLALAQRLQMHPSLYKLPLRGKPAETEAVSDDFGQLSHFGTQW